MLNTHSAPSTRRLLKATAVALVLACIVLVTTVLPAEYGIDPTGIGSRLGLDVLAGSAKAAALDAPPVAKAPVASAATPVSAPVSDHAADAAASAELFGAAPGQTFDKGAIRTKLQSYRRDTLSVVLPPGEGAEIKAILSAGDALVFHWKASADVAVDMHGERTDAAKDEYTSYSIDRAKSEASGQLIAPFNGRHGWYWLNRGSEAVTVQVDVAGFHENLFRPGHP